MPGRRPTPTHLKLVLGNPGKRRTNAAREPTPARTGAIEPPAYLTPGATEAWRRLAPVLSAMGVLTVADGMAFESLCEAYADVRAARAAIEVHGDTVYETRNIQDGVMRRPHPEVAQLAEAEKRLRGLLGEFGLTPAARSKVSLPPAGDDKGLDKYFG